MASQEHDLTNRDAIHVRLMLSVLHGLGDTPLVLKGGTALLPAYGLDRFSEDLDFDAPHKLNLESRIRNSVPYGIQLANIDLQKDTPTVTRYRVHYQSDHGARLLKIEISYRSPAPASAVRFFDGFRVALLARIIDQKLQAAHDGEQPRSKIRDLYDLDFLTRRWPAAFDDELICRIQSFASDPDALVSRYRADFEEDDLVPDLIELEQLALRLHCAAEEIAQSRGETIDRIANLWQLKGKSATANSFWRQADQAISSLNTQIDKHCEVNWRRIEEAVIEEHLAKNSDALEEVIGALCQFSPGAAAPFRQAELRSIAHQRPLAP